MKAMPIALAMAWSSVLLSRKILVDSRWMFAGQAHDGRDLERLQSARERVDERGQDARHHQLEGDQSRDATRRGAGDHGRFLERRVHVAEDAHGHQEDDADAANGVDEDHAGHAVGLDGRVGQTDAGPRGEQRRRRVRTAPSGPG